MGRFFSGVAQVAVLFVFFSFLLGGAAQAGLNLKTEKGKEIITLSWPATGKTKVFTLSTPPRIVVDVPYIAGQEVALPEDGSGMVQKVRSGRYNATTTRLVFELAAPPAGLKTSTTVKNKVTTVRIEMKAKRKTAPPTAEKPLVVIDAGHGGQDPGAIGAGGTREKDVVLAFAHALKKALLATGRYRVQLTREGDSFIMLRERVMIARKAKANMFVSLHADSGPEREARGVSVYTLSEKASDAEAEALAARENKVDSIYGMDLSGQSEDVAGILLSLAQRDTMNKSAQLADKLVEALRQGKVDLLVNTHRFAGFAVLKGPDIPAVLVETGFLSNAKEEKQLVNKAYREKVSRALAEGIDAYFAERPVR